MTVFLGSKIDDYVDKERYNVDIENILKQQKEICKKNEEIKKNMNEIINY